MNLNLKQKIVLSNLLIGAALLIIAGWIIYPTIKQIINLKQDIGNIQNQTQERYERTQKLKRSLKELTNVKQTTEQIAQGFITSDEDLVLITTFENLANQYHIDQTLNLNLTEENKNKADKSNARIFPNYYRLSFLNQGSFSDQLAYLGAMEQLPYYVIIENLNFEQRKNTDNLAPNTVILRFDALIYVDNK